MKTFISTLIKLLRRRWKLVTILAVVLLGVGFFLYRRSQPASETLQTTTPQIQDITKTLEITGVVDAKEKANMRFAAGGKVVYLGAKEGDVVSRGQTLATIDRRELQKTLQQNLNTYMQERNSWENTLDDIEDRVIDTEETRAVQNEQLTLNNRVLDVEINDVAIQNTVLSAPFAGILVSSPTAVTGVNLMATDVFELVNPETLVFKGAVDEADIGQVQVGQPVEIRLEAYPDEPIQATVATIGYKSQQTTTGTVFMVEMPLIGSNLLSKYRLGMSGDVDITLDTRSAVMTIPLDATRDRDGKTYVDVLVGENQKEEREIQVGLKTEELVEVTGGLSVTDQVVLP
jgi:macrolide-specific efflux system membrane fusion protein